MERNSILSLIMHDGWCNSVECFSNLYSNGLDGWGFSFRRSQLYRYEKYMEMIERNKGRFAATDKVLEIGCGQGFFTAEYLLSYFKDIMGVDISEEAIQTARRNHPQISFLIDSLPNLQQSGVREAFRLITMNECLYYLPEKEQETAILRAKELCVKNGYLMVSVNIGEKPYFSKTEIVDLLQKHFSIIDSSDMCIKQYYQSVECKIWKILEIMQWKFWEKPRTYDTMAKKLAGLLFGTRFAKVSYNRLIAFFCKILLYYMPIKYIDKLERYWNYDKSLSVYIVLCRKG